MGIEIERKFLVKNDSWRKGAVGVLYQQGYIPTQPLGIARIRIAGDKGKVTFKGDKRADGISNAEFEYDIPVNDAREMLATLCIPAQIKKMRYRIEYRGNVWEVDEFMDDNQGLIVAEVELPSADHNIDLPSWIGEEVSHDRRYANVSLVELPFIRWNKT